jgi:hypothetical protein
MQANDLLNKLANICLLFYRYSGQKSNHDSINLPRVVWADHLTVWGMLEAALRVAQ